MEHLTTYLRRVANDQRDSGRYATAEDYDKAAAAIDELVAALESAVASFEQLVKLNRIPNNLAGLRDARTALAKVQG